MKEFPFLGAGETLFFIQYFLCQPVLQIPPVLRLSSPPQKWGYKKGGLGGPKKWFTFSSFLSLALFSLFPLFLPFFPISSYRFPFSFLFSSPSFFSNATFLSWPCTMRTLSNNTWTFVLSHDIAILEIFLVYRSYTITI